MSDIVRRGWRERVEPGLYRAHRVGCSSSRDRKPRRRCSCPWQLVVPGALPGRTRLMSFAGAIGEARSERRRLLAEGRPEAAAEPSWQGTLDEFAASYFRLKSAPLAPATIRGREEDYLRRISPRLGGVALADLTRGRVEEWLAELVGVASSHRMIHQTVATLRAILSAGVEWGRLNANPAGKLRLPQSSPEDGTAAERVLTEDQLVTLFTVGARSLRVETILRAAGEAGLRRGEVVALSWPDVDLGNRRITVRSSAWQERGVAAGGRAPKHVKGTKGRRARRVAMSEAFSRRLADWYALSVVEGGASASGFVWPGRDGGPTGESSPRQALDRALVRAGLIDGEGRPLVTFHGLRHTAASVMLARGVPLLVVSRQLGHANSRITAQVYEHLAEDRQLDAAADVFDVLGNARTLRETLRERGNADETRITRGFSRN